LKKKKRNKTFNLRGRPGKKTHSTKEKGGQKSVEKKKKEFRLFVKGGLPPVRRGKEETNQHLAKVCSPYW